MIEDASTQGRHPVCPGLGEVLGGELALAQFEEAVAELAPVEGVSAGASDGLERPGDAGAAKAHAGGGGSGGDKVIGILQLAEKFARTREERGRREAVSGVGDRRGEDVSDGKPAEPVMEREPAVDAAGDRHRADVAPEGHRGVALRSESVRVGAGAGAARRVEDRWRTRGGGIMDEGKEIAAHTAHVLAGDGEDRAGGDGGIGGATAGAKHGDPCTRRQMVDAAYHPVGRRPRRGIHGPFLAYR